MGDGTSCRFPDRALSASSRNPVIITALPVPDTYPAVPAFPQVAWQKASSGSWTASRGLITIGTVRQGVNGFTAFDAAGYHLGTFDSLDAAQTAILQPYEQTGTASSSVLLWVPETHLAALQRKLKNCPSALSAFLSRHR